MSNFFEEDLEAREPFERLPIVSWEAGDKRGEYKPKILEFITNAPRNVTTKFGDSHVWDVMEDGVKKSFFVSSKRLLSELQRTGRENGNRLEELILKIVREGEGFDTTYQVEVVGDKKVSQASPLDIPEPPEVARNEKGELVHQTDLDIKILLDYLKGALANDTRKEPSMPFNLISKSLEAKGMASGRVIDVALTALDKGLIKERSGKPGYYYIPEEDEK